ncbi:unnamed protein product [Rhizoctonia solani]|nr:unnamed protein product [Rhizoctonia solani]
MPLAIVYVQASIEAMAARKQELRDIFEAELKLRPKSIKNIEDLKKISYPTSVNSPDLELSFLVGPGQFRYHRSFLLQFKNICTERPVSLAPLDSVGLDPRDAGPSHPWDMRPSRRRVDRHSSAMSADGSLSPRQSTSFAVSGTGLSRPRFFMGDQYSSSPPMHQSRFEATHATRPSGMPFTGDRANRSPHEAKRTRDQRRRDRYEESHASGFQPPLSPTANLEPVAPLERSENRWIATNTLHAPQQTEERQLVDHKVRALLNKLTMDKFDSIAGQIIDWANKSEQEDDGATLKQVVELILEQAKEDTVYSEAYARLCRRIMNQISPNVQDKSIGDSQGQLITGEKLFRKYLLGRCQDDLERKLGTESITLAAFALQLGQDKNAEIGSEGESKRMAYFNEYYAKAKSKRRRLGLVRFIGELHKSQMLTDRIIHECIKKLLANNIDPKEEEIESLCEFLLTVGQNLDSPKARNHMDIYFERMQEMVKGSKLSPRIQFMLLDVIELRERHWQHRHAVSRSIPLHQPSTRNDSGRRAVTRGGTRRSEYHGNATEPDGWNITGGAGASRPSTRAGDLSQFGKISKPTGIQFGPSSVFKKKDASEQGSGYRSCWGRQHY